MKKHKEGDYITYKVRYPDCEQVFHASGTIEKIIEKNGRTEYLVAEGNGGANMTYVNPETVVTLLTE